MGGLLGEIWVWNDFLVKVVSGHLKNMQWSTWIISPIFGVKNWENLKPPPSFLTPRKSPCKRLEGWNGGMCALHGPKL